MAIANERVPVEVSNSFSDPATIVVVASACTEYGPITVVNCSPVTITSGSTCIVPRVVEAVTPVS